MLPVCLILYRADDDPYAEDLYSGNGDGDEGSDRYRDWYTVESVLTDRYGGQDTGDVYEQGYVVPSVLTGAYDGQSSSGYGGGYAIVSVGTGYDQGSYSVERAEYDLEALSELYLEAYQRMRI